MNTHRSPQAGNAIDSYRQISVATLAASIVCVMIGWCIGGCAQNTESPLKQQIEQQTPTPVATDQSAATQGSTVNVWLLNTTADGGLPGAGTIRIAGDALLSKSARANSTATANGAEDSTGGYVISGVTINVTTGGTTPSLTGTATGAPQVGQTSSPNTQTNPEFRARGEVSAAMPIGVAAPGGMVDQQATATGRGTTSGTTKESANELRWARLEATAGQVEKFLPLLEQLLGGGSAANIPPAATTQPAN